MKARVHAGRLEPMEELALPDGMELTLTLLLPDTETKAPPIIELETWDLGSMPVLTRAQIYEDVI